MLNDYLTDIIKREWAACISGSNKEPILIDTAIEQLIQLRHGSHDILPTLARIIALNFDREDARCMAFPSDRYMHWPLKLDRRKDHNRSY